MRSLVFLALVPMLSNARACGSEEPPATMPAAAVSVSANAIALPTAKHGGTVVAVDDVQMELVVKGDGEVVAYPVQATPSAAATLTADARVTVDVPVQTGGTREVNLVWSPVEARFVGRVRGATVVTTQPADVNVTVVSHGRRRHHRVQHVVVAPAVVVARPAATVVVERPAATVVVERPAATVVVQRPIIDVRVGGGVVIEDDRHHHHHDNGLHRGHHMGGGHRGRH